MIRDAPHLANEERGADELTESIALSLSWAPLRPESPEHRHKAPRPLPPTDSRPDPPVERPPSRAQARGAFARLPLLFPPVGSQWNNSPFAYPAQRAPPRRRRRRVWPPVHERFAYFPPPGSGYERLRRRRRYQPPAPEPESDRETEESRDDATSSASTAPSRYHAGPDEV